MFIKSTRPHRPLRFSGIGWGGGHRMNESEEVRTRFNCILYVINSITAYSRYRQNKLPIVIGIEY